MELPLDPRVHAHRPDPLDIAGAGAVGQTVEDVQDLSIGSQTGGGWDDAAHSGRRRWDVGDCAPPSTPVTGGPAGTLQNHDGNERKTG